VLRVALTGGIASGKSYVLARLAARSVPTIDADALVHEALAAGSPAVPLIAARFGRVVLARDGSIDRKVLAQLVFADTKARAELENLLHPDVFRRIDEWFAALSSDDAAGHRGSSRGFGPREPVNGRPANAARFAVADIPLLFETHHDGLFDRVIVTICSQAKQLERMMKRDGLTREEALGRLHAQWPMEDKARLAHYVIDTNRTFEETDRQVDHVLAELTEDARRSC